MSIKNYDIIIDKLKTYLISDSIGKKIVKIYYFGSRVKGKATKDSDVDILIISNDGREFEEDLLNKIYDFQLEYEIPLEVITYQINDLYPIKDYLLYNIIQYGKEVYSMSNEEIKNELVNNLKVLTEEYLESSIEVLEKNRLRLSIDAAYNAAELSTKALILLKEDDLPGSHGGIVNLWSRLYVKTGKVDKELGRALNISLKLRNDARYKPHANITLDNANYVINTAKKLLELIS